MDEARWIAVDQYFERTLGLSDRTLEKTLAASRAAGLPAQEVAPNQARMLQLFAQMCGARRMLEIGTLGGYSAICLARVLPAGGELVTLEANADHARVAADNIAKAGLADRVRILVGDARVSLARLREEGGDPIDFAFIDADKASNPIYLEGVLALSRPGTVIVGDNIIRAGRIVDPTAREDADVRGVFEFFEQMGADRRLSATALQTVGEKGWDGFALARVL
ncbi:O-methyltransferase [Bordetella sp. LUAb4]|uniref:O-methyltransferase n=1 Tax=Bordetella sp. LUAb4 TaxID=2843195 RepID=UPI001E352D24|nr:O-methyltransferase [Bordetella sp. LUAb4]